MKMKPIEEFYEGEKRMVRVPLGKDNHATVSARDWHELMELGLSGNWRIGANGHVIASCRASPNGYVLVSRVLLGANEHESVRFKDKNPKNLRKSNIKLVWDPRSNLNNSRNMVTESLSYAKAKSGNSIQ